MTNTNTEEITSKGSNLLDDLFRHFGQNLDISKTRLLEDCIGLELIFQFLIDNSCQYFFQKTFPGNSQLLDYSFLYKKELIRICLYTIRQPLKNPSRNSSRTPKLRTFLGLTSGNLFQIFIPTLIKTSVGSRLYPLRCP